MIEAATLADEYWLLWIPVGGQVEPSSIVGDSLWLKKHTDLRAHDFAYTCGQPWPTFPGPEAGDFVKWTLLYIVVPLIWLQCHTVIMRSKQEILFRVTPVWNGTGFVTASPTR